MSPVGKWDCAKFCFSTFSANIEASARDSSWNFQECSNFQVESPRKNVVEARREFFFNCSTDVVFVWIKTMKWKFAQFKSVWKKLQTYCKWKTKKSAQMWEQISSTIIHTDYFVLKRHRLHKHKKFSSPFYKIYSKVNLCSCVCWK